MDIYHIVKRPLVTEKGTRQSGVSHPETHSKVERGGAYTFEVHSEASKPLVKKAVEQIYNVKVLSVRTAQRKGKRRRRGLQYGQTPSWKKAVVVLAPGYHIDLF